MMTRIIRYAVDVLRQQIYLYGFMLKVFKRGGICAKGIHISHPALVEFEKLKIKSGYRIDFFPEFAGIKLPPPVLKISNNVIIGYGFTALVADKISIGSNTILASNVALVSENHGVDVETEVPFFAQPLCTGPITIGEGCWLGQNVVVLPNVNIGDKVIIGANSVVTKDIPSFSIAAGIPARVIKKYVFEQHSWIKV